MTTLDWLIVLAALVVVVIAVALLWSAALRDFRVNGWGSRGLFRRPAAPRSIYALVLVFFGLAAVLTWALVPRGV